MTMAAKPSTLEMLRARARKSPVLRGLALEVVEAANGSVLLTLDPPPDSVNGRGFIHGGFLFSICDTACAFACLSQTDGGVTQSAHITYVSPGRVGERLAVAAHEAARTTRTQTFDAKVTSPSGATIAIFRGIFQLLPPKSAP